MDDPPPLTGSTTTYALICPDGFVATFLDSWPESLVTNDTSRRIWDMLCTGFVTADTVYGSLDDRQQVLRWDMDSSIRLHASNVEQQLNDSWTDTLARLDANNRIIQSTVENLSDNITSLVTCILAELTEISKQVKSQSGILNTITHQNTTRDAYVQDVKGRLVVVKDAVAMFDAHLMGIRTMTEETMTGLRNDINDVRARVILQTSAATFIARSMTLLTSSQRRFRLLIPQCARRLRVFPPAPPLLHTVYGML